MTWSIEVRFNQTTHRSLCCVLMLEGYDSCQILVNHTAAGSLRDGFTLQCSLCIQRGAVYYGERGCIQRALRLRLRSPSPSWHKPCRSYCDSLHNCSARGCSLYMYR
jgi:hypothetical protein